MSLSTFHNTKGSVASSNSFNHTWGNATLSGIQMALWKWRQEALKRTSHSITRADWETILSRFMKAPAWSARNRQGRHLSDLRRHAPIELDLTFLSDGTTVTAVSKEAGPASSGLKIIDIKVFSCQFSVFGRKFAIRQAQGGAASAFAEKLRRTGVPPCAA
jgi:hypothetical protein